MRVQLLGMEMLVLGGEPDWQDWQSRHVVEGGPPPNAFHDLYQRIVAVEKPGPPLESGPFARVAHAIDCYDVFPVGRGYLGPSRIIPGATVGLRYHLIPGVDVFFASRVVGKFNGPEDDGWWRSGFTYRTLRGHPEFGEETFTVQKRMATGEVRATLQAWSRPGLLLARAFLPLTRHLQKAAGRAALDHLERIAQGG